MKKNRIILFATVFLVAAGLCACTKEKAPTPSDGFGLIETNSPAADADPRIWDMFEDYAVNVVMDWPDAEWTRVYSATFYTDQAPISRQLIPEKVKPENVDGAIKYAQTLLSNTSPRFTAAFFPMEWWIVGVYAGRTNYLISGYSARNRFTFTWPNTLSEVEVTDPDNHYYIDRVLTEAVWQNFFLKCALHMETPLGEFVNAGKAYDKGKADELMTEQRNIDLEAAAKVEPASLDDLLPGETLEDARKRLRDAAAEAAYDRYNEEVSKFCASGGFIPTESSTGVLGAGNSEEFIIDFASWARLIVTESYDNIKVKYLDNSVPRRAKYDALIKFFDSYGWDIQAAGNTYRQKNDQLAPPEDPDAEE